MSMLKKDDVVDVVEEFYNVISKEVVKVMMEGEEINFIDYISASNGWHPLEPNSKMTVHYCGKEYQIIRN